MVRIWAVANGRPFCWACLASGLLRWLAGPTEEASMAGDKTAIVTGAGSGIGKAVATTLLKAGWNTVFCGRRVAMLEAAIAEAGDVEAGALAVGCDITRPQEVEALFGKAVETFGRVDLLFNNAG